MQNKEQPLVATYFFPHDKNDVGRLERARQMGKNRVPSDHELLANASPLYPGHIHPRYAIGEQHIGEWSDDDPSAIAVQTELAIHYGINAWILLGYSGMIGGKVYTELGRPLQLISQRNDPNLKFALMTCFGLPRVNLPVQKGTQSSRFGEEKFDISPATMHQMVDYAAAHWNNPRYLFLDGRPFLIIYGLNTNNIATIAKSNPGIVEDLRRYCERKYGVNPFLAANTITPEGAVKLRDLGFDYITTYSSLPTFNGVKHGDLETASFSSLQTYREQFGVRKNEWQQIKNLAGLTFSPNASVGWDASGRGQPGLDLAEVEGDFPWTPIITDSTPENFRYGLEEVWQFIQYIPPEKRILLVLAWNEIGDGASLLPRVRSDKSLDFSYLETLQKFLQSVASLEHSPS
jgi:hypothetical protein